jgi:hypothetical protein
LSSALALIRVGYRNLEPGVERRREQVAGLGAGLVQLVESLGGRRGFLGLCTSTLLKPLENMWPT